MTVRLPDPPSRAELRRHLVATGMAGEVATPRDNNLEHYELLARGARHYLFGLEIGGAWTPAEVLAVMAKKVGVDPDPNHMVGIDTIDPDRTIDALESMAARIREAARRREDVLLATGHPAALLPVHIEIARALEERGCAVRRPAAGWAYAADTKYGRQERQIRYVHGVAMLSSGGGLQHTHSPRPMREMLRRVEESGEAMPGLVVADHGWAGAAGQAGLDVVGFADSNDPALFVGEVEGKIRAAVPLDDNVDPGHYALPTAYVLGGLDRPGDTSGT